ncbi:hypothetical protein ACGE24_02760 [Corynebacterium kroppenstedtii]|uniref:hypothetical protein n=1 Tax=Corynebacterium sp. PCR 32 TaxID=3351342 RepID=UPI0030953537
MAVTPGDVERRRQKRTGEASKTPEELNAQLSAQLYDILDGDPSDLATETDRLEKAHNLLSSVLEDTRG